MRKISVARRTETDQSGQPYSFEYCLLAEEAEAGGAVIGESYGVQVTSFSEGTVQDTRSIPNLTVSAQRIHELMDLLVRNCVTPVSLDGVVEDWLAL